MIEVASALSKAIHVLKLSRDEKRQALDAWARYLGAIINGEGPANIVRLAGLGFYGVSILGVYDSQFLGYSNGLNHFPRFAEGRRRQVGHRPSAF